MIILYIQCWIGFSFSFEFVLKNAEPTMLTNTYHSIILQSIIFVVLMFFLKSNVGGTTGILGKNNYEVHSQRISCPFSTEFLLNMTCYVKRINRTSENYALDIFIKPGVKVYSIFVSQTIFII